MIVLHGIFIKKFIEENDLNPLYCVILPGYIWEAGMKNAKIRLQTLQNKDMILLFQNIIRGGINSFLGDRNVKSDKNKKTLYIDATILYGWAMIQSLPNDEIKVDEKVLTKDIFNTEDDSDIGYILEFCLQYPGKRTKRKFAQIVLRIKLVLKINLVII